MAVQSINISDVNSKNIHNKKALKSSAVINSQPSFQGLEQIPIAVADGLTNGGFITSFIAQDFFGMACPRVLAGFNRRPVNKETGKKEGPYNWKFATREGLREILSGPSAFIIPAIILHFIKKYSGTANNVPINMIQALGNNFIDYAAKNPETLDDVAKTKTEYYKSVFKNVLKTSMNDQIPAEQLETLADDFTKATIEIEQAKAKPLWKVVGNVKVPASKQDLTDNLLDAYMKLRKQYLNPSVNEQVIDININPEKYETPVAELLEEDKTGVKFKKLLKTMRDFSDDVIESTGNAMKKCKDGTFDAEKFLKRFVDRRTGSRILSNLGMWLAVVGFYALIPKLYSIGQKGKNPAFAMEHQEQDSVASDKNLKSDIKSKANKDVAFTGKEELFTGTAEKVLKSSKLKKFINHFEFDDASMSVSAMAALLYGFCYPTRWWQAPDKYDRRETNVRDLTSFGAILFAANGLARGLSQVFEKVSGLALNIIPADHNKNFYTRFIRDYFSPISGINVLSNKELDSKYVNIQEYKNGIHDFFDFITENGGNLKKLLQKDSKLAEYVKVILGKDVKDAVDDNEIKAAFKNIAEGDTVKIDAKNAIINIFKDSKNKFVRHAKLYNSTFTFASTIALVPMFMIWLARTCDKMTRKARARDLEKQIAENPSKIYAEPVILDDVNVNGVKPFATNKITMQGFLNR